MSLIINPEKGLTLTIVFCKGNFSCNPFKIESLTTHTVSFGHSFGLSPSLLSFGDSFKIISGARLTSVIIDMLLVPRAFISSF